MAGNPKISICVSVYNTAPFLARFLDSALNQSFKDYEIVLTDNHSTDESMAILERYQEAFPEKVFVFQTDAHGNAGKGRNLSFIKSRGKYIYWCDADDLIHPHALTRMYEEAIKHNADVVRAYAMRMNEEDGDVVSVSSYSRRMTASADISNETLIKSGTFFWLDLIRRDLIERVGLMPEDNIFEDVRYLTRLHSYAQDIRYLDFPVYYWSKRGSSTTFTVRGELCEDAVQCDKDALDTCNSRYLDSVRYFIAWKTLANLDIYWPFFNLYIDWIHKQGEWFYDNEQIREDQRLFGKARWADSLSDIQFPNIIYVDGFAAAPGEERLAELREKVFQDGCEIVVLSPETCDINENEYVKRAYERGNMALVTGYFALKNIYENGGVFIHNNIRILNYFSYLKYQNAFFSLIDKTTYSEWIYGAPAGNEAIAAILKTFSGAWNKKGEYMPLSERISIILTAKYGIPLDGKARLWGKIVSVLPPDLSVADTRFGNATKKCAFEHDFSACAGEPDYITLPRTSLRVLLTHPPAGKSRRERALEKELSDMKKTNTYKLMMKIRTIGDGPVGPFLKKIFHWMLRVRKKLLRK